MRNQESVFKQNKSKSPFILHTWARTLAWQWSRSTQESTWQRRCGEAPTRVQAHPRCGCTPLDASWAHSSGGGAFNAPRTVACGAYQKYYTKPSYSSYIRRPPPHSMDHHTLEEKKKSKHHFYISLKLN